MRPIWPIACALIFALCPWSNSAQSGNSSKINLNMPLSVTVDKSGNVYIADTKDCLILMADQKGNVHEIAGTGTCGFSGDGGPATEAELNLPGGITVVTEGRLVFADTKNNRIREITVGGDIITIAGTGAACTPKTAKCGDGGPATEAELNAPSSLAFSPDSNIYIADSGDNRIRKVNQKGIISTFEGTGRP